MVCPCCSSLNFIWTVKILRLAEILTLLYLNDAQNVKGVFDAAIKVVIQPPTKQREKKKKKSRQGCSMM